MITHELAKKLKEAGFPQNCEAQYERDTYIYGKCYDGFNVFNKGVDRGGGDAEVDCPNLSELIEACGDDFDSLCRCGDLYQSSKAEACSNGEKVAGGFEASSIETEDYCVWAWGDSAEEAVAKLWLELNKK